MLEYKDYLKDKLGRYFDIEESYQLEGNDFELFAKFNQRNAKYMMMKNLEIFAFQNNEYILYKKLDKGFGEDEFLMMKEVLNNHVEEIIDRNEEHMSSVITFIFETELPDDEAVIKAIKKFKYYKSFLFGLKGWVNGKIMLIDPVKQCGISNKLGKGDIERFLMH